MSLITTGVFKDSSLVFVYPCLHVLQQHRKSLKHHVFVNAFLLYIIINHQWFWSYFWLVSNRSEMPLQRKQVKVSSKENCNAFCSMKIFRLSRGNPVILTGIHSIWNFALDQMIAPSIFRNWFDLVIQIRHVDQQKSARFDNFSEIWAWCNATLLTDNWPFLPQLFYNVTASVPMMQL